MAEETNEKDELTLKLEQLAHEPDGVRSAYQYLTEQYGKTLNDGLRTKILRTFIEVADTHKEDWIFIPKYADIPSTKEAVIKAHAFIRNKLYENKNDFYGRVIDSAVTVEEDFEVIVEFMLNTYYPTDNHEEYGTYKEMATKYGEENIAVTRDIIYEQRTF